MIRRLATLAFFLAAPPALGQTAPTTHEIPFPSETSETHALDLALGGTAEALSVRVASAPAWLRFETPEARAEAKTAEPVARLAFSVDPGAPVGEAAAVELVVTDASGAERARHTVAVEVAAPELSLAAPVPNPSRGGATVAFTVPAAGPVRLALVDMLGREVAVLAEGERAAGAHTMTVPRVASGVYVVRLAAGGAVRAERLTVVR